MLNYILVVTLTKGHPCLSIIHLYLLPVCCYWRMRFALSLAFLKQQVSLNVTADEDSGRCFVSATAVLVLDDEIRP